MGDAMMTTLCSVVMGLIGTEQDVIAANAKIEQNAGIPYPGTDRWDTPKQAYQQEFWFIYMPNPETIFNGYTGAEMMNGVVNVSQEPFDPNWIPPPEEK